MTELTLPEMPWFRMAACWLSGFVMGVSASVIVVKWLSTRPRLSDDLEGAGVAASKNVG